MTPPTRDSNPFATCWTNPLAAEWIAAEGPELGSLVSRLQSTNWRGQIVGPHGVGKSTLLAAMCQHIEGVGRRWVQVTLGSGERGMGWHQLRRTKLTPKTLLVVDGYEQLGSLARRIVRLRSKFSDSGLLVTAHEDVRLPMLAQLVPSLSVTKMVFRRLTFERQTQVTELDVADAFNACNGNIRETLFKLYDLHERHARAARNANIRNAYTVGGDDSPIAAGLVRD